MNDVANPVIRIFKTTDVTVVVDAFAQANWPKSIATFHQYLDEQLTGERRVWIVYVNEQLAGYVTLKRKSLYPPFASRNIPEIMDLNVLPVYRKLGIGTLLLATAEKAAATQSSVVGLGVGLYKDYGAAQRLYIQHGYVPDGQGVTYHYLPAPAGSSVRLDDDLVLWFTKSLKK